MVSIKQSRLKISLRVLRFLRMEKRRYLVIRTFTGSGKTTSILKLLDRLHIRWIYIAPNHDIIEENVTRSFYRNYDFLHIIGREKSCIREDIKALKVDPEPFCYECHYRDTLCKYEKTVQKAYRDLPHLALVHAHLHSFLPSFLSKKNATGRPNRDFYDVVVIDESPIACFMNEMTVTRADLTYLRECLQQIPNIGVIYDLINDLYIGLNYHKICDHGYQLRRMNEYNLKRRIVFHIKALIDDHNLQVFPNLNIISFLFGIFTSHIKDIKDNIYRVNGELNLAYFTKNIITGLGLRTIVLDGTATESIWQMMTPHMKMFRIDYIYHNAIQFCDARYPISSWKKSDGSAIKICTIVDKISVKKKRKVLLVGTKDVLKKARLFLKQSNYEYAWYYNLRSRNSFYLDCDTVALLCEPNPPQEKIDSCVALSGWSEDIWRRLFREEEMLQAIGRVRQNIKVLDNGVEREDVQIFLFPNTGGTTSHIQDEYIAMGIIPNKNNVISSSLLPEARIMTTYEYVDGTSKQLEEDIDKLLLKDRLTLEILKEKYTTNRSKYLLDFMFNTGYIMKEKEGDGYFRTEKGDKRLPLEEKIGRGWIKEKDSCLG